VAPGVTLDDGPHSVFTGGGTALVIHDKADEPEEPIPPAPPAIGSRALDQEVGSSARATQNA